MNGETFTRILMVLVYHSLTCQLRNTHYTVRVVHSVFLYGIHRWIDLTARTVKVGCMNVYAQRLSAYIFCIYSRRESEPVVGMDNIKLLLPRHDSGNNRIIVDLFMQV